MFHFLQTYENLEQINIIYFFQFGCIVKLEDYIPKWVCSNLSYLSEIYINVGALLQTELNHDKIP